MAIQVSCREVLNNLILFRDRLEKETVPSHKKRVYLAFANRHTGVLCFKKEDENSYPLSPKGHWRKIHVVAKNRKRTTHFSLTTQKGKKLSPKEFNPVALHILFEMIEVLNRLVSFYRFVFQQLPEIAILQNLSAIHISSPQGPAEIGLEGVRRLSRLEAEKKLLKAPARGNYLIRHGEYDEELASIFSQSNRMWVKIYVLAFVESQNQISERLLIQNSKGWTFCRDESDLSSPLYRYYNDLPSLLHSIRLS